MSEPTPTEHYDLVVVGFGAAGLSAALTFLEETADQRKPAKVAVLERSSREERGGATRWTGAFLRITEDHRLDTDWVDHVDRVSGGLADTEYCRTVEREVPGVIDFIEKHGVKVAFEEFPMPHTFKAGKPSMMPPASPVGGGASIVEHLGSAVESDPRADVYYRTEAVRLSVTDDGVVNGVVVRNADGRTSTLYGSGVVLACGGFEGNPEMLTRYVGERACDLPLIAPGVAQNQGDGLRMAMELGAATSGQFDMVHAEPVDRRTTAADAVLYGYQCGIFVNGKLERFFDEGRDTWDNTFEHIGYEIWKNQGHEAYWVGDGKSSAIPGFLTSMLSDVAPEQADTLTELAEKLGVDAEGLEKTVAQFNASTSSQEFDPTRFDGKSTVGATPPKSNWAVPLDTPPFIGVPVTAAICFTYGGIRTNAEAQVVTGTGTAIPGLYAAGEATGLYYHAYPPATSVLRSLVFGRVAARHLLSKVA